MKPIAINSYRHGVRENDSELTISNLTKEEAEILRGMVRGFQWATVEDGRLKSVARHHPLPGPSDDTTMMPYWRRAAMPVDGKLQVSIFDPESMKSFSDGSIQIQSLCGYNYSEDNYQRQAGKLISWGFECLRSRRQTDGGYWEIWHRPGPWCAKGELGHAVQKAEAKTQADKREREPRRAVKAALEFLRTNVEFGTLDITAQRYAMVISD